MGHSSYSSEDYKARTTRRSSFAAAHGIDLKAATFDYDYDIKTKKRAAKVHDSLDPYGVKIRESRDSEAHPITVPIAVVFDTTGSMDQVPATFQKELTKLMGHFLDDKASGKKYLGDGYPAIMIGALDDDDAQRTHGYVGRGNGTLQIGQFESGIEIDDNLTNIWLTENGGGTYEEDYELAMYFMARHTAHDHWDKRGKKGYLFLLGDEHPYPKLSQRKITELIGDPVQDDIPLTTLFKEVKEHYHVFFIIPNLTFHYDDKSLFDYWVKFLGQQNVLKLEDPTKVCEMIAGAVAICENHAALEDLDEDGLLEGIKPALVPLSKSVGEVSKYDASGLPPTGGGGSERI